VNQYVVGQTVRIGGVDPNSGDEVEMVNRVDVTRPDGSVVTKDWDARAFTVKVDRPGIWVWEAVIREGGASHLQSGQFEVVPRTS
jgi:hypothetical protein